MNNRLSSPVEQECQLEDSVLLALNQTDACRSSLPPAVPACIAAEEARRREEFEAAKSMRDWLGENRKLFPATV